MALLLRRGPLAEALRAAGMDNESTCPLVPLSFPCSSPSSDAGDDDDWSAASRTPSSGEEGDATAVAEREGQDALATQHVIQALSSDLSSMPPAQLADLIRQTSGGWLWCAKYCTAGALLHKRGESESVAALLKGLELLCSERVEAADLSPSVSSAFRGALAKCSVVGTFLFVMLRLSPRSALRRALLWMAAAALCVRVLHGRLRQAVDRWLHRCLRPNHVYRQLLIVVLTQLTRYIALNHKFGAMVFPPLQEAAGRSNSRAQQSRPCPSFSQQVSCILSQQHLVDTEEASGVDLDRVLCCVMKDACDTSLHALRIEGLWRRCGWGSIDGLRAWYTLGSIYLVRGAITIAMSSLPQRDIRLIDALTPVVQDALLDAAVDHLAESSSRCETASENTGNHSLAHVRVLLLQRILANIQETLSSPTLSADGRLRTEQQEDDGPNDGVPNQGCMPQHYDAVRWNLLRACRVWFEPSCLGAATQSPRASQLPVCKAAAPDEPDDDDLSGGLLAQPCPGRHEREELQADGLDAPLKPVVARNIDAGMVRLPQLPKHIQAQRSTHAALELFE